MASVCSPYRKRSKRLMNREVWSFGLSADSLISFAEVAIDHARRIRRIDGQRSQSSGDPVLLPSTVRSSSRVSLGPS
jgi:hypothetical protein